MNKLISLSLSALMLCAVFAAAPVIADETKPKKEAGAESKKEKKAEKKSEKEKKAEDKSKSEGEEKAK
jgi:hypothetical protein